MLVNQNPASVLSMSQKELGSHRSCIAGKPAAHEWHVQPALQSLFDAVAVVHRHVPMCDTRELSDAYDAMCRSHLVCHATSQRLPIEYAAATCRDIFTLTIVTGALTPSQRHEDCSDRWMPSIIWEFQGP